MGFEVLRLRGFRMYVQDVEFPLKAKPQGPSDFQLSDQTKDSLGDPKSCP